MDIINIKDKNLYYIGGVVRDEILGRKSLDVDITYVGNAIEYCSKTVKAEIVQENPDFGTVRVLIRHCGQAQCDSQSHNFDGIAMSDQVRHDGKIFSNDEMIVDIASTRSESYPHKGHLPVVEKIGCSLKEDVLRRDFTINALAKNTLTGEIVDYTGGLEDLKNKKLRVLHDESFIDDPTRIIRGLKFSVRFGFELEEHTRKLQEEYLENINYDMSYKRVKKELVETFNPLPNFSHSHPDNGEIPPSHKERGQVNIHQLAFEKFINEGIYKLVTPNAVEMPKVNIENLVNEVLQKVRSLEDRKLGCLQKINTDKISSGSLNAISLSSYPPTLLPSNIWLVYVGVLRDLSRLPLTKIEQKILDDVPQTKLETDFELYKAFENAYTETVLLYAILVDESGARRYLDFLRNIKISVTGKDLQNLGLKPSPKYQEIFDAVLKEKLQNPEMTKDDEINFVRYNFHG